MASRFSFGEIATRIGEMRRAIDTSSSGAIIPDPSGNISDSIQAAYEESAHNQFIVQGDTFIIGFHKWGNRQARIGK